MTFLQILAFKAKKKKTNKTLCYPVKDRLQAETLSKEQSPVLRVAEHLSVIAVQQL